MKEEEKLLGLNLEKEQQKQYLNHPEGFKLYLFRALYTLLHSRSLNFFCQILFSIIEFIQLMAFPMDTVFSSGWKNYWYGTIGNFFRFSQLTPLWSGNTQIYLITYILTCLYNLLILILFLNILSNTASIRSKERLSNRVISLLLEFEMILNIPFLKTLFGAFTCENGNLVAASNIKCKSGIHYSLIIISIIFIIIFELLISLFQSTLFEFGTHKGEFKAAYTSSIQVVLALTKLIFVILYQFIKNGLALSIITFLLSLIILMNFLSKQPYSNGFALKLYFGLYLLLFWSSTICIIAILLKNSKFEGGVLLLIIGYPIIIISVLLTEWNFSFEKIFQYIESKDKDAYKALLEIEYFLKMEENLEDKIRTKEQKVLYSYISNYEKNCSLKECPLKQFMKIPLKVENFVEMKICLLQHGEMLFKNAVSKFPFYAKLRLSYGLFLYNKLNKKLQGTNEITLLNKYNTNLEDSFLVYKAQRYIQEENEGINNTSNTSNQDSNSFVVNSSSYKSILNTIKSLIGKITMNYIDFWTILAISGENKSENFQKMSRIGTKITKLNEELAENIGKLETVNLYDQDTLKLYIQFLIEILSDNIKANIYNNKLSENEQKRHQYNEENLFELNYKAMSKSEDYKYIIVSCSHSNFDEICNISLSACPIFGYSKEELLGHPFDYLIPELFSNYHKKVLQDKVEEFKKKLLIKNVKIRSESWTNDCFIKNKMKYLVPIKIRWTLVSSEDEIIYGIGKVITERKTTVELEQEVIYILTDKNLIIQNFTANAPKLLFLHSSAINNNLDITDFIKEFNEDYVLNIDNFDDIKDIKESCISNMSSNKKKMKYVKTEILKKMFMTEKDSKKLIHWRLGDIVTNELNIDNKKNGKFSKRSSFVRINYNDPKFQSALIDTGKNFKNTKIKVVPKRKISVGGVGNMNRVDENISIKKLNSSLTEDNFRKLPTFENDKNVDLKDTNISDYNNVDGSLIMNDRTFKEKVFYHRPVHHKFNLSVKEVKFSDYKVGYIFKFETLNKNLEDTNIINPNKNNQKNDLSSLSKPDYNDIDKSEISIISFAANKQTLDKKNSFYPTPDNPFGINIENSDLFFLKLNEEKENEFTIDMGKMSYKQLGINEKLEDLGLYELLRQEAVEKISKVAKQVNKEEISEEEESSSGSYYSSRDDSSNNNTSEISSERKIDDSSPQSIREVSQDNQSSQKNDSNLNLDKKNLLLKSPNYTPAVTSSRPSKENNDLNSNQLNNLNNANNTANKHKIDDYYHVNMNNITYYIYNYTTGFVEVLKDQKYKTSEILKKINVEKEKLSKMNAKYIAKQKKKKKKKKGNINKKIANDTDELNSYNEQTIKLKEIQKALTSKEKQTSIINLCIFSFITFILIIGSGVMSIMINFYLKSKSYLFYDLIKNSINLYKNILFEITFVREIIIINSTYYHNFYDPDQMRYFLNYRDLCIKYYTDTSYIISNLTTDINTLDERQKELLTKDKIYCYIIDPVESKVLNYSIIRYELPLFSAYRELNAALYHISQLNISEIYTYDDNIYFFLKNGMSNLLIYAEKLIKLLTNEFYHIVKSGFNIIILCLIILFVVYTICYILFNHFYEKVQERKQTYLSIFYEIGGHFIILSLSKCEKFSQKLQSQTDNYVFQGDKISIDSSSLDESDMDNDVSSPSIIKQNKDSKITTIKKDKNGKDVSLLKIKIFGFIIFFLLLACQYGSYVYYYFRLSLYKNCVQYEYYLTDYMASFLFPFIGIREYIYDQNKTFYNTPVFEYIDNTLSKFYLELAESSKNKDKYVNYFPKSYTEYLNNLYSEQICVFINQFIKEYPENGFENCNNFFYDSAGYGFFTILTIYIEEIRKLRDLVDEYISITENKYKYNESFYNDPNGYYEILYKRYENVSEEYRRLNPVNVLRSPTHKTLFIVYRFIISKVIMSAINKMFSSFEEIFDATTQNSLIINIIFILVVVLAFSLVWLPFVLEENETIFKTKNMLSIIPNEILITLPHINVMLGIEEETN